MRFGGKTFLHLQHSLSVVLCSVLQKPPYCQFPSCKCNSGAANLQARLQHYLLFEIMALGSSKALGDRKHSPVYARFIGKDYAEEECRAACCSEESVKMDHSE